MGVRSVVRLTILLGWVVWCSFFFPPPFPRPSYATPGADVMIHGLAAPSLRA